MIKIEHIETYGWEAAIRGMRNPLNSWGKSDSKAYAYWNGDEWDYSVGEQDLKLMKNLVAAGPDHGKFMRMIGISMDITAPLYWWKEYDTYKVGTVANSCSTMHKIAAKEFELDDFSHEHLFDETEGLWINADGRDFMCSALNFCQITCDVLNHYRDLYLRAKIQPYKNLEARADRMKRIWWQMIQLLPSSYNQKRTVTLNYAVARNQYHARKAHKLTEWHDYCKALEGLPYAELITMEGRQHD